MNKSLHMAVLSSVLLCACSVVPNQNLSPAGEARLALGLEYMKRQQYDRARQHLNRAYQDAPAAETVVVALGQWYLHQQQVNSALLLYQQALSWQPMSGVIHNNLAIALCLSGKTQQAMAMFDKASALAQDVAENRARCSHPVKK